MYQSGLSLLNEASHVVEALQALRQVLVSTHTAVDDLQASNDGHEGTGMTGRA